MSLQLQLSLLESSQKINKIYFNGLGEPLPWEEEEYNMKTIQEVSDILSALREEYKNALPEKREAIHFRAIPWKVLYNKKVAEEERKNKNQIAL
jgi:hypothetical protein